MLARADAGRLALDRQPHDLHALIEAAVEDARILAEGHALTFEITLPSFVEEFVDERYFTRILLNLLSNAVKYNRIGGTVRVDLAARENTWLLEIANTGRGIPPGHRAKLFERFFRSDDGSASPARTPAISCCSAPARCGPFSNSRSRARFPSPICPLCLCRKKSRHP